MRGIAFINSNPNARHSLHVTLVETGTWMDGFIEGLGTGLVLGLGLESDN